eukprot:3933220-Rhodomonas_salina.2
MDLAMRWIACCSHCFPEFEETAGWFFVVLGWRPTRLLFLTSENQRASVVDGTLFFVWIIGCGIMGWITSSRRTEYIRGVATSTICDPSQPYVLRVSSSELDHDGYFTKVAPLNLFSSLASSHQCHNQLKPALCLEHLTAVATSRRSGQSWSPWCRQKGKRS